MFFLICSMNHQKEIKDLTNQIRDLERQREAALREVADLKTQLKLVEEARDNVRRDLIDSNRKVREGQYMCIKNQSQKLPVLVNRSVNC